MTHYDLVIIGTGSGNSLVTPDFNDKRVAVIEKGLFGGTCLNVGCIPTKMFVYAAEVATAIRGASRYGVDASLDQVRWADIRDRVFGRIDPIAAGGKNYRVSGGDAQNTTAYLGTATFTGPRELSVEVDGVTEQVTGDQVVIATGSYATVPPVVEASGVAYETSDTVMRLDALPASMVILGGGFIATEFAHVFSSLGVEVTIVNRGAQLLRKEDTEISEAFTQIAQDTWDVRLNRTVSTLASDDRGVHLTLDDGTTADGEVLLVATGRAPATADLGLDLAGVERHDDGRVRVDEFGRTNAEGVWSLGDASNAYQLKHVANAEARAIAHNLTHPDDLRELNHRHVPAGVFTHPQIASVGMTEEQAREAGHDVTVKTQAYGDTAYGWAMEDTTSLCKLVADRATGQLLGAHIMGPNATTVIQPVIQAMNFGLSAADMARGQYWIHPAMIEVLENALLGLDVPHGE
ncbi:mycothione reductase [Demetria terragena]|uniref:mycothione reductase n=1 Tax=Demetria terragena TaxID=63959 RepID=UPI000368BD08|nr:mycothione reductase [Demetria terragena]